jgi:hypothetical protein
MHASITTSTLQSHTCAQNMITYSVVIVFTCMKLRQYSRIHPVAASFYSVLLYALANLFLDIAESHGNPDLSWNSNSDFLAARRGAIKLWK